MVGPSYKENETLISGEGDREEKKSSDDKADNESREIASWSMSDLDQGTRCRSDSHG